MLEKTEGTIKNGQSRYTGNIGHTRYRTKIKHNTTRSVRLYSHVVLSTVDELLMLFVFIYVSSLISVSDDVDVFQHQQDGCH
jgi:hypothetical protein